MTINNVSNVRSDINEMLSKIRDLSNNNKVFSEKTATDSFTSNFEGIMSAAKSVLTHVNDTQVQSEKLKNSYIAGDSNVPLSQVILSTQKSKLAFEGLVAVRNKLLDAYKEIMSMSI